jgi:hypothetical protein
LQVPGDTGARAGEGEIVGPSGALGLGAIVGATGATGALGFAAQATATRATEARGTKRRGVTSSTVA